MRSPLKTLSSAAVTASFQIWLCQESRKWIIPCAAGGITPIALQSTVPNSGRHTLRVLNFVGSLFRDRKKITYCGYLILRFGDCKTFQGYLISWFQ